MDPRGEIAFDVAGKKLSVGALVEYVERNTVPMIHLHSDWSALREPPNLIGVVMELLPLRGRARVFWQCWNEYRLVEFDCLKVLAK